MRRYVRDAGPLLDRLNQLTRADVTTRNERRADAFARLQDDLEARIAALAELENLEAIRPPLDGRQVMELLDLQPGPAVGEALAYLMELRMERGPIPEDEAVELFVRGPTEPRTADSSAAPPRARRAAVRIRRPAPGTRVAAAEGSGSGRPGTLRSPRARIRWRT